MSKGHRDWKCKLKVVHEDGKLVEYTIALYRTHESGWYDEIRYDSHEQKKGRNVLAPHFHMKLRSSFKDLPERSVEEIRRIIDNHLDAIRKEIE